MAKLKPKDKIKRIVVYMPETTYRAIRAAAFKAEIKMTQWMREAAEEKRATEKKWNTSNQS